MKIIYSEGRYRVFSDGIESFNELPPRSYRVAFSKEEGFFLVGAEDVRNVEKVYGNLDAKAEKVFKTYENTSRSIGVLMSGEKGIGKTMMARILCQKANNKGIPVIIISQYVPGIAQFLGTIQQPALLLFDEFEKMFSSNSRECREDAGDQPEMLSLLDGLYASKWLFVFTCNHTSMVSDYILGRPGRIHYHFRFQKPDKEEIKAYLKDNIPEQKWPQISEVVAYANYAKINYDALRAIAFEFRMGGDFKDFIGDLNIERLYSCIDCNIYVEFNSGEIAVAPGCQADVVNGRDRNGCGVGAWFGDVQIRGDYQCMFHMHYNESDIRINEENNDGTYCIPEDRLWKVELHPDTRHDLMPTAEELAKSGIKRIIFVPVGLDGTEEILMRWNKRAMRIDKTVDEDGESAFNFTRADRMTIIPLSAKRKVAR